MLLVKYEFCHVVSNNGEIINAAPLNTKTPAAVLYFYAIIIIHEFIDKSDNSPILFMLRVFVSVFNKSSSISLSPPQQLTSKAAKMQFLHSRGANKI